MTDDCDLSSLPAGDTVIKFMTDGVLLKEVEKVLGGQRSLSSVLYMMGEVIGQ